MTPRLPPSALALLATLLAPAAARAAPEPAAAAPSAPAVWSYRREFAERFGLPPEGIDDSLDGALARVDFAYAVPVEFPHKGVTAPMMRCGMALFIDSDALAATLTGTPAAPPAEILNRTASGLAFLPPADTPPGTVPSLGISEGHFHRGKFGRWPRLSAASYRGSANAVEYRQGLFPGIDYLVVEQSCAAGTALDQLIHLTPGQRAVFTPASHFTRWNALLTERALALTWDSFKRVLLTPGRRLIPATGAKP